MRFYHLLQRTGNRPWNDMKTTIDRKSNTSSTLCVRCGPLKSAIICCIIIATNCNALNTDRNETQELAEEQTQRLKLRLYGETEMCTLLLLCLRCRCTHVISFRRLQSSLLSGNKGDRIKTSKQCAAWSQYDVDYFFSVIWPKVTKLQPFETKLHVQVPPGGWIY